jgi:hypothetical protein
MAGVGHDVLHAVEVHDAQLAGLAERLGDGQRHLGLGLDDLGLHFLHARAHFLFGGDGHGAAAFRLGLAHLLVCLRALGFQQRAHVGHFAATAHAGHADVGDINGDDLERGLGSRGRCSAPCG